MIEIEILVDHRYRQQFDEITKESKMEVVKEEKTSTEVGSWVTIQMSSPEDAYWLGRNYEQAIKERHE